jgi:hypothetical protein
LASTNAPVQMLVMRRVGSIARASSRSSFGDDGCTTVAPVTSSVS